MRNKMKISSLFVILSFATVSLWGQEVEETQEPSTPSGRQMMAQPGFLGVTNERTVGFHFGFPSAVYLAEPRIWGILLLTEEQGAEFKSVFDETMLKKITGEVTDSVELKALAEQFETRRAEILDPNQIETIRVVHRTYHEMRQSSADGKVSIDEVIESLRTQLTPEQMANFESMR